MAIFLEDLIKDPRLFDDLSMAQPLCCRCGTELQETITGKRSTPQGDACSDCYYEELGNLVEQHPIVSAGVRRG
jgi:hypothetical protein